VAFAFEDKKARKPNGKKVFLVKWRDASGKWVGPRRARGCRTEQQAQRFADDMERQAERYRHGLEPLPGDKVLTFGDLFEEWWKNDGRRRRSDSKFAFKALLEKHLKVFWTFVLNAATAPSFATLLQDLLDEKAERGELAPQTLNHVRAGAFRVFQYARHPKCQLWKSENPVQWVTRYRVPKRKRFVLQVGQILPVLLSFNAPIHGAPWRWVAALCLYLALRPGEAMGLWKEDVDVEKWVINIRRSWSSPFPKDVEPRQLHVPTELRPYLLDAMRSSPNHLVFPTRDGKVFKPSTRWMLVSKLRAAAGRAGIVDGYLHTCRRCRRRLKRQEGTFDETATRQHPDSEQRRCPTCDMKLWISPIPKKMRFYDLRHTSITILIEAGVGLEAVGEIAGHADPKTTKGYDQSPPLRHADRIDRALTLNSPAVGEPELTTGSPQPVTPPADGASGADLELPASQQISPLSKR
jgi:integrase